MSAEAPKQTGITASVTLPRPEGGFRRFLRKLFDVPLESQPTPVIIQPSQGLESITAELQVESKTPLSSSEPDLPKSGETLNLETAIEAFVDTKIKDQEDARKIREAQKEEERLEKEAKAQQIAERVALIKTKNEKGKEIISISGVRNLIEQARAGLTKLYPNATTAEEMGDSVFDTVYYGIYDNLPPVTPKERYKGYCDVNPSFTSPILDETPEDIQRKRIIDQRWSEQHKLYDKEGKRLYKVRLAWSEYTGTKPIENITDRSKDYDDNFSYIDILSDGWDNKLIVRRGLGYVGETDQVFEEKEWKNQGKLEPAILEAIKSPCRMQRYRDRLGSTPSPSYGSFGYYGKGESRGGG